MALLNIVIEPDPRYGEVSRRLRQKSAPVDVIDDSVRQLAADLFETMHDANGVGLAAPQVGILKRMAVIHVPAGYDEDEDEEVNLVLINPEVVRAGGQTVGPEGCLSFPDLVGEVSRYTTVTVKARGLDGKSYKVKARGVLAVALQHEIDHLDGILFFDRMPDYSGLYYPRRASDDDGGGSEGAVTDIAEARERTPAD